MNARSTQRQCDDAGAHLCVHLLGSFTVALDDEPVTAFATDKTRALLAYLAVEADRAHRREALAGLLWPDYPERSARRSLTSALAALRQAIGDRQATPPFLHISRQTIQFNTASDAWVDVTAFSGLLTARAPSPLPIPSLQDAVALYRGPFLAGFSLPDSPAFEEWALLHRERLQRRVAEALLHLAEHHAEAGAFESALQHARRLLELDPLQEAAHRQVMHCLAASGRRTAALAQYQACRQVLAQELGVEPAPETTALATRIRAGELAGPIRASTSPRHNLPRQPTPFVGRAGTLAAIAERLEEPACRLLTLVGPGGSGKTRLALQAAAAQLERYPDGVFFVSLAPLEAVGGIVPAVADALGFTFYVEKRGGVPVPPQQQLLDYLRGKHLLLVMDNYEHLLSPPHSPPVGGMKGGERGGAALVTEILRTAPHVKVLATSRARLNVGGEHRFPIGGMDYPDPETLVGETDPIAQYSAVQLFLQGAQRAQPGFELSDDTLNGVLRICALVQGMPLALRLAAAWVAVLTPAEIAAEIARNLDLLETERNDVPARQHSVRATFDHSWRLLTGREREVLQAATVFRGGFTLEAAQAVTGATLRELRGLVDKSLLQHVPSGRYEIHELLHQYAQEKRDASPGAQAAHERHCAYFCARLERWGKEVKGARQGVALAEMRADQANIRAAWEWAVAHGDTARLGQLVEGLGRFYTWCARYQEGETACRAAAETLASTGEPDARVLGNLLVWQGSFNHHLGRLKLAAGLLQRGLQLLEGASLDGADTRAEKAHALFWLSATARDSGEPIKEREMGAQSVALYRAVGDSWGTALLLGGAALAAAGAADYGQARRSAEESLALRREIGDQWGIANVLTILGQMKRAQGELEASEGLIRQSIAIQEQIDYLGLESVATLRDLIFTLCRRGEFTEACVVAQEALARCDDRGIRGASVLPRLGLGMARAHQGNYEEARAQLQTGLDISREMGLPWGLGNNLAALGHLALPLGAYTEAQHFAQELAALAQEPKNRPFQIIVFTLSGYVARELGEPDRARRSLCQVLQSAVEFRDWECLIDALPPVALLLADAGEVERAVELYALASRYPYVANSRWFEDVVGKPVSAVATSLPQEIVATAQERGRARDLWATAEELLNELRELGWCTPARQQDDH